MLKIIFNILSFCFVIVGIIFYKLALLSACERHVTQANCLIGLDSKTNFFYILGLYMIISIIILEILRLLMIKKYISYLHLIYMIPLYIYMVHFYDTGGDLVHHGAYNKIIFYLLIVVIGIIIGILLYLFYLYKKKYYKVLFSIGISVLLIYLTIEIKVSTGCNRWLDLIKWIKSRKYSFKK